MNTVAANIAVNADNESTSTPTSEIVNSTASFTRGSSLESQDSRVNDMSSDRFIGRLLRGLPAADRRRGDPCVH